MITQFVHPMQFTGQYVGGYWAGYRFKEALGYTSGVHTGVDYNDGAGAADKGLPVKAIAEGRIVLAQNLTSKGFGNTVIIEHDLPEVLRKELGCTKLYSRYMHMENLNFAAVGKTVHAGQQIGTCGMTGTQAYHLHIDLWSNKNGLGAHTEYHKNTQLDSYFDPYLFIESHKVVQSAPQGGSEMAASADIVTKIYRTTLQRDPDPGGLQTYVGRPVDAVVNAIYNSPEAQTVRERETAQDARREELETLVQRLNTEISAMKKTDGQEKEAHAKEVEKLTSDIAAAEKSHKAAVDKLNDEISSLRDLTAKQPVAKSPSLGEIIRTLAEKLIGGIKIKR